MVKPDGNMRDHYRYLGKPAHGNSKLSSDGVNVNHNSFGYTGEMWDEESELLYLRARYYEPEMGRFLSRDSYEGELGNPLSKHLYTYVHSNPVNFKDPTGHWQSGDELLPVAAQELIIQYSNEYDNAPEVVKKMFGQLDANMVSYFRGNAHQKAEDVRNLCNSKLDSEKIVYKLWLLSNPNDRMSERNVFGGADTSFILTLKHLRYVEKFEITKLDLQTLDKLYEFSLNAQINAEFIAMLRILLVGSLIKGAGNTVKLPDTQFTTKKLQHEFKHAGDFGVKGNWNKVTGEAYQKAIQNHIDTATNVYKSTYRGQDVYVHINKNTGLGTYTDLSGNYVGGWKFSADQMNFHITNGTLIK